MIINKIATRENLQHMGVELDSKMYVMCQSCNETISHLFFTCRITTHI